MRVWFLVWRSGGIWDHFGQAGREVALGTVALAARGQQQTRRFLHMELSRIRLLLDTWSAGTRGSGACVCRGFARSTIILQCYGLEGLSLGEVDLVAAGWWALVWDHAGGKV